MSKHNTELVESVRTEKYTKADDATKTKVDNILSALYNTPINDVQEIIRIAQSEIFAFTKKATEDVVFN